MCGEWERQESRGSSCKRLLRELCPGSSHHLVTAPVGLGSATMASDHA